MNRVQYRILAAAWYASIYRIKWSKQVSHMSFIAYVYVSLHMYTFFLTFVLIVHTTAYVHEYIDVEHISMHAKCVLQCVSQCVATCCGVCCSVCCCALLTIHWCTHRRYIVCTLLICAAQQLCIRIDTHATHCNTHRSAPSNNTPQHTLQHTLCAQTLVNHPDSAFIQLNVKYGLVCLIQENSGNMKRLREQLLGLSHQNAMYLGTLIGLEDSALLPALWTRF